jgi:hypothetical protein
MRPLSRTYRLKVRTRSRTKDVERTCRICTYSFLSSLFHSHNTQFYSHPNLPKLQLHQLAHTQSQIVIIFANLSFAACPFSLGLYLRKGRAFYVVQVSTWKKAYFKNHRHSRSSYIYETSCFLFNYSTKTYSMRVHYGVNTVILASSKQVTLPAACGFQT